MSAILVVQRHAASRVPYRMQVANRAAGLLLIVKIPRLECLAGVYMIGLGRTIYEQNSDISNPFHDRLPPLLTCTLVDSHRQYPVVCPESPSHIAQLLPRHRSHSAFQRHLSPSATVVSTLAAPDECANATTGSKQDHANARLPVLSHTRHVFLRAGMSRPGHISAALYREPVWTHSFPVRAIPSKIGSHLLGFWLASTASVPRMAQTLWQLPTAVHGYDQNCLCYDFTSL